MTQAEVDAWVGAALGYVVGGLLAVVLILLVMRKLK